MVNVAIIGAGIAGLGAALALGRRGHEVHVYETDAAPVPDSPAEMWAAWSRPGTPQAHHIHNFQALAHNVLRDRAADVLQCLLAAGAVARSVAARVPGGITEPGDEDLTVLNCRRPVFEGVLRRVVEAEPGITLHSGHPVDDLVTVPSEWPQIPRIVGIHTRHGAVIHADLVVDASGRRSRVPEWLTRIGARAPVEETAETGVVYFNRYFKVHPDLSLDLPGGVIRGDLGYLAFMLARGDNRTFVASLLVAAEDRPLRALRHEPAFMAAMRSIPEVTPWLAPDRSFPIGEVQAMGDLRNMLRRFVVDGRPVVLGLHVIGDALCHTDPFMGAGASLALTHAFALADVVDQHPADPIAQALALDAQMADEARGFFDVISQADHSRLRFWRGETGAVTDPSQDFPGFVRTVLEPLVATDAAVFRAVTRHRMLIDPPRALEQNRSLHERALAAFASRPVNGPPPRRGPTREELPSLITAARSPDDR